MLAILGSFKYTQPAPSSQALIFLYLIFIYFEARCLGRFRFYIAISIQKKVKIIDTHVHSWDMMKVQYSWMQGTSILFQDYLPEDLAPQLYLPGVQGVVLVQSDNSYEDTDYMLQAATNFDWILGVIAWLNLCKPEEVQQKLHEQYLKHPKFRGIRHLMHIEPSNQWLLQKEVQESLEVLATSHCIFEAIGINAEQFKSILHTAEKHPSLTLVIDHLNQPPLINAPLYNEWCALMKEAATYPNLHAKISGLGTMARPDGQQLETALQPALEWTLECFGADRCICGGDWPISLLDRNYNQTWEAYKNMIGELLKQPELKKVFYQNALELYKLA